MELEPYKRRKCPCELRAIRWRVYQPDLPQFGLAGICGHKQVYIRKREEGEKALLDAIDPSICQDAEWPVKLSEWKLRAGVRTITKYQAKRFAAALGKEAQTHG